MKVLFWDLDGFVLYYKRLERGTFSWILDSISSGNNEIDSNDFALLLSGINPELKVHKKAPSKSPETSLE